MAKFKFLVIGTEGGESSLIAACLGSHPDIDMILERYGEDYLQGESLRPPVFNIAHRTRYYRRACDKAASRASTKIWGNKLLDSHIRILDIHNERCDRGQEVNSLSFFMEQCIPDIKIILAVRDSRTCIASKLVRGKVGSLEKAFLEWKYLVTMYEYLKGEEDPRYLLIKFEDLLRTPELTCTRMAEFLGLSFHSDMITKGSNGVFDVKRALHKFLLVDHPYCTPVLREQKLLGYI